MGEVYRQILSATVGAAFLAGLSLWSDFVFWFNILVSAGMGLGAYFTIPGKKDPAKIELAPGITQADLNLAVSRLSEYERELEALSNKCGKRKISLLVREMGATLGNLSEFFQKNPDNLSNADMFVNHFAKKSADLVSQYVRLSDMYTGDGETDELGPVEETIRKSHASFKDFHRRCLRNELADLEVSAETLTAIAEMEFPDFDK